MAPTATTAATPRPPPTGTATAVATPTAGGAVGVTTYVDPSGGFAVGYPSDWRRQTEDEIRAQLGIVDQRAAEVALANIVFVVIAPDGRALVSLNQVPLLAEGQPLEAVVQAVRAANLASVAGIEDVAAEPIALDGVDAVRLTFTAADPATGEAGARLIRQVVATDDGNAIVLSFIASADDAAAFEATFQQIEASWRWQPSR